MSRDVVLVLAMAVVGLNTRNKQWNFVLITKATELLIQVLLRYLLWAFPRPTEGELASIKTIEKPDLLNRENLINVPDGMVPFYVVRHLLKKEQVNFDFNQPAFLKFVDIYGAAILSL